MSFDLAHDGVHQFVNAAEDTVSNSVLGDLPEPAFDDIQTGTACRNKVNVESGVREKVFVEDKINAILAAAGSNLQKLLRTFGACAEFLALESLYRTHGR